jgi:hypothetical protein
MRDAEFFTGIICREVRKNYWNFLATFLFTDLYIKLDKVLE